MLPVITLFYYDNVVNVLVKYFLETRKLYTSTKLVTPIKITKLVVNIVVLYLIL